MIARSFVATSWSLSPETRIAASIRPENSSVRIGCDGAPRCTYTTAAANSAPTATTLERRETVGIEAAISILQAHTTHANQAPVLARRQVLALQSLSCHDGNTAGAAVSHIGTQCRKTSVDCGWKRELAERPRGPRSSVRSGRPVRIQSSRPREAGPG